MRQLVLAVVAASLPIFSGSAHAQPSAPTATHDLLVRELIDAVSAERIERDIRTLVGFGTRHTLSETESETRGIGAARRWIKAELDRISDGCGGCLEVSFMRTLEQGKEGSRIPRDTWIVNVLAVLRGQTDPGRYVIMAGDIDSRVSDALDATSDSPGANDNASGMAGVIEAARVLSQKRFDATIVLVGLSGEEQGLFGGKHLAAHARETGWRIEAVLNNDMIGNIHGLDGVVDNSTFRVFSEPTPVTEPEEQRRRRRFTGGEVDGASRQLARYVDRITDRYFDNLAAMMIYRLDRFGRGGHHRPFNDADFPGVRIMEAHENYTRQHQTLREEDGVAYGDVIEGVDFEYAARLTAVNVATLASLASAPPAPRDVAIAGAVRASTTLYWAAVDAPGLAGYKLHWRETTAPQWTRARFVGNVTEHTLVNVIIDNFLFGVSAVGEDGSESVVAFPSSVRR